MSVGAGAGVWAGRARRREGFRPTAGVGASLPRAILPVSTWVVGATGAGGDVGRENNAVVDLRSDTLTRPTDAMRAAMFTAEVGDDVFGEDPTVHLLERRAAGLLGKEAGLLVPTGTMGNLVSLMAHCEVRGSEAIVGDRSHIHLFEQGGMSTVAGIHPRVVRNLSDGRVDLSEVRAALRPVDDHFPTSQVLCLENTHNMCGGRVLSGQWMEEAGAVAKGMGLKLHIDGARLCNASAATGTPEAYLARHADSVSVCLSKGLGAPCGSVVVGDADFVRRCRRHRKVLGGGMRQAGILAAAGLVALDDDTRGRLVEDHANARALAVGLGALDGIVCDVDTVDSNIVFFRLEGVRPEAFVAELRDAGGVKVLTIPDGRIRAVFHRHVSRGDVDFVLEAVELVLRTLSVRKDAMQ